MIVYCTECGCEYRSTVYDVCPDCGCIGSSDTPPDEEQEIDLHDKLKDGFDLVNDENE
jgi:hypothetical protein